MLCNVLVSHIEALTSVRGKFFDEWFDLSGVEISAIFLIVLLSVFFISVALKSIRQPQSAVASVVVATIASISAVLYFL